MQKPEKYDWKESNLSLFGSDSEKKVKKESAETEPAWKGSGQKVGLEIWRINKFKVEKWPKEDYGKFFSGDSYIVMNTWKEEGGDELQHDIHFWIGKYSTQDEYGTAAYKTVELDTFHNDKPIQHREVQGNESGKFKEYFDFYTVMKGGCDTGFRRVGPTAYKSRLFQKPADVDTIDIGMHKISEEFGNTKFETVMNGSLDRNELNSNDVYVVSTGTEVFAWVGKGASIDERKNTMTYIHKFLHNQNNPYLPVTVVSEGQKCPEFEKAFENA